ncbi:MAG: ubiquinone/menaquinone biosynthesis methyltransferase [Deltaproteobacteria bacterium]|nr:ubiquinone/menaquinone biosynthesis methyltransferase [Deltaproteobacteria bacterium]
MTTPETSLPSSSGTSLAPIDAHGSQVQRMFDRIAGGYDRANRVMSLGIDERWRRRAVADLLRHVPADRVPVALDLCAGTLDSSLAIHRAFPRAKVLAGDFAAEMLERGRAKLVGEAAAHIDTAVMDAHALPVDDASCDAIFCAFGIRNLSDLGRACAEQARALRPGGKLVVLDFFRPDSLGTRIVHAIYNRGVLPWVGWAVTGDREAYQYLPRSIGKFDSTNEYAARLQDAGFVDVRVEGLTMGVASIVRATRAG